MADSVIFLVSVILSNLLIWSYQKVARRRIALRRSFNWGVYKKWLVLLVATREVAGEFSARQLAITIFSFVFRSLCKHQLFTYFLNVHNFLVSSQKCVLLALH